MAVIWPNKIRSGSDQFRPGYRTDFQNRHLHGVIIQNNGRALRPIFLCDDQILRKEVFSMFVNQAIRVANRSRRL